jgi:hypothetical protein
MTTIDLRAFMIFRGNNTPNLMRTVCETTIAKLRQFYAFPVDTLMKAPAQDQPIARGVSPLLAPRPMAQKLSARIGDTPKPCLAAPARPSSPAD